MNKDNLTVAVVGATGAVGREILNIFSERRFPAANLKLFASPRSEGAEIKFEGGRASVLSLCARML